MHINNNNVFKTVLVSMLELPSNEEEETYDEHCELYSRVSVVLADLAQVPNHAKLIADTGGIQRLVDLLDSDVRL